MTRVITFYKEVYEYIRANHKRALREADIECVYVDRRALQIDEKAEILISGTLHSRELELLPNLKAVIVSYTGLDGLNLDELGRRNIRAFNTSAHAHFVAERAVALVLAVMGRVVYFHNELNKGSWGGRLAEDPMRWSSMYEKKIGIYGYGRIGCEVSRLLKPFNGEHGTIKYKDRCYDDMIMFDDLKAMAEWCDVLIVSAPLNDDTDNSIGKDILEALRDKTLINIARGQIINEDDLYHAVVSGVLAGFGSDVWYTYPTREMPICSPSKYSFENFDNVVMTPHNAGFEENSRRVRYEDVIAQIYEIARGDYSRARN